MVLRIPPGPAGARTTLMANGRPQRVNQLILERVDGDRVRLVLVQNEFRVLESPALAVKAGRLAVRLDAPWLYPPPAHPYWDGMDPAAALELQTLFGIAWDSGAVTAHSIRSVDPVGFEPAVAGSAQAEPDTPSVESIAPAAPQP